MVASMPSTSSSSLQASSLQRASSLKVVKGKAELPQIHIMWIALGDTTLPWWSRTTRIGLFLKCHSSLMILTDVVDIVEGWYTEYHVIEACSNSKCLCLASVNWSTMGIHTISYGFWSLILETLDSLYICSRIDSSSSVISRLEMSNNTFFFLRTSRLTWFPQNETVIYR